MRVDPHRLCANEKSTSRHVLVSVVLYPYTESLLHLLYEDISDMGDHYGAQYSTHCNTFSDRILILPYVVNGGFVYSIQSAHQRPHSVLSTADPAAPLYRSGSSVSSASWQSMHLRHWSCAWEPCLINEQMRGMRSKTPVKAVG